MWCAVGTEGRDRRRRQSAFEASRAQTTKDRGARSDCPAAVDVCPAKTGIAASGSGGGVGRSQSQCAPGRCGAPATVVIEHDRLTIVVRDDNVRLPPHHITHTCDDMVAYRVTETSGSPACFTLRSYYLTTLTTRGQNNVVQNSTDTESNRYYSIHSTSLR